jgi:soluble lytic murein transglycosylase
LDSALDEMRVGRFWHATRILRDAGVVEAGEAGPLLVLARAEAGWKNWTEVARLLRGRPWLASESGGEGLLLQGRAEEEAKRWTEAQAAYRSFLAVAPTTHRDRPTTQARLVRASRAAGDLSGALAALDGLPPGLLDWGALEGAEALVASGDTASVAAMLARVVDPDVRASAWRVLPRTRLAAGDSAGALSDYRSLVAGGAPGAPRAQASTEAGRLALALGDSAGARPLLVDGFAEGPLASRARAAAVLLSYPGADLERTLELADVLDRAGDNGSALRAYDRAALLVRDEGQGGVLPEGVRFARARLMAGVRSRQAEAEEEFRAIRASTTDPVVGARNLDAWAALEGRRGREAQVATIRTWLIDEYPTSTQAAELLWDRGIAAEGRGDLTRAQAIYESLGGGSPDVTRTGEARMRLGQLALGQGRVDGAAATYEAYLADFPTGRRWEEASFWAAKARLSLGDTASARRLLARVRRDEPVSYYAVMGADLLGLPFEVAVPEGDAALRPAWLAEGLARLDLLREAGLTRGAETEERALVARARGEGPVLLTLAEALIDRGRTVAGINLAWDLRREGAPWDRRLLRAAYPFPYREMVIREAKEWGLDPVVLAAIIRQESAFEADIRSPAGAVGLMQVMPPTGRELAGRHGPAGFTEDNLEAAEVNLHLGAVFFRDMSRRYSDDLPLVLSAYNAGPTRATRWKAYPEASDPLRFTERIPFDETRNYVKYVRRNIGLYRLLYDVR